MKFLRYFTLACCAVLLTACGTPHRHHANTIHYKKDAADIWERIRSGYGMEPLNDPKVKEWEDYYSARPEFMKRVTERSGKYIYYVVEEIERRGLPTELALLPIVESAYRPDATSHARAAGLWQFIPSTGRNYKLTQTWWSDERRDPKGSTDAALSYLAYLYEFQSDWHLALASYNWGEGSVKRAREKARAKGQSDRYEHLVMPRETANYVPKLMALRNIIANPKRYGVTLSPVPNKPYYEDVQIDQSMDASLISRLAGISLEEFYDLNPGHHRPQISANTRHILLPVKHVAQFKQNLKRHDGSLTDWKLVHVGKGHAYSSVAKKYKMSVHQLKAINGLSSRAKVSRHGQNLLVARHAQVSVPSIQLMSNRTQVPVARKHVTSSKKKNHRTSRSRKAPLVVSHKVKRGETLYSIAHRYRLNISDVRKANGIKGDHIRAGMILKIHKK